MSEHDEQAKFVTYCEKKVLEDPDGNLDYDMYCAVPNQGKRSKRTGQRFKEEGLRTGFPDMLFFVARGIYHGLVLEFKFNKKEPTEEQDEWAHKLSRQGYACFLAYSGEKAIRILEKYLSLKTNQSF